MATRGWEKYIVNNDENKGIADQRDENPEILRSPLLCWSNDNGEEGEISKLSEINIYEKGLEMRENQPFPFPFPFPPSIIIEPSNAKKEEHNAKERERRMKLSQAYFSLRSLLPNARRSKKRWSSSTIIDKVVDYIPTLKTEIANMQQKKKSVMTANEMMANQTVVAVDENQGLELFDHNNPTVSIHQCRLGEVIIQICINYQRNNNIIKFSNLIRNAEAESLRIIAAASQVSVSDGHPTLTCHLHLQMDRSLQEDVDYKSILRKRVISWLC